MCDSWSRRGGAGILTLVVGRHASVVSRCLCASKQILHPWWMGTDIDGAAIASTVPVGGLVTLLTHEVISEMVACTAVYSRKVCGARRRSAWAIRLTSRIAARPPSRISQHQLLSRLDLLAKLYN